MADAAKRLVDMTADDLRRIVREEMAAKQAANDPEPAYLRSRDVAAMLNCSARQVQLMAKQGMPHKRVGSELRFRRSDVEDYVARKDIG